MSTIKRYTVDMKLKEFGMVPILKKEDEGEVVLFSDHEAEVERLGAELELYKEKAWMYDQLSK